jgi:hypothetical protein
MTLKELKDVRKSVYEELADLLEKVLGESDGHQANQ